MGKKLIKTKIVCTLGPASSSREVLVQMIKAGMDYVRLNFSHGTHDVHRKTFELVRSLSKEFDHQLGIICDIQGPKIRTGLVDPAFNLAVGDEILVTPEKIVGNRQRIQIKYETMLKDLDKGDVIFINDGIVRLVVKEKLEKDLLCVCEAAGNVSDHKGCNIPSGNISLDVLTSKDREDLKLIAELDPEYVALSFIGRAADLHQTRALLAQLGNPRIKLISKVERPIALQYLDEVVAASDAVMVARGDLGVEIPAWEVPAAQKRIVRLCNKESVPVIVATQMLESMVQASRPTRAEASDVFNAVLDGADAVMLSGETSVGAWPVLAVEYMDRIANEAESRMAPRDPNDFDSSKQGIEETIGHAAYSIAGEFRDLKWSGAIVVLADDPALATLISKYRPGLDIVAISSNLRTVHELALVWGVRAVHAPPFTGDFEERAGHGVKAVQSLGLLGPSDHVLVIARSRNGVLSGLFPVPRLLL